MYITKLVLKTIQFNKICLGYICPVRSDKKVLILQFCVEEKTSIIFVTYRTTNLNKVLKLKIP